MGKAQTTAVVWLALLLASSTCAFALDPALDLSQYAHTAWKVREGFIKGTIFSLARTPDGYLWLGTESGLQRFDGVNAIPWQPPHGEQLPDGFVRQLLAARDGTLWIGTDEGLASLKDGRLTQYPEVSGQGVTSLLQDAEGMLWFGVRDPGRLCAVRAAGTQCYETGSFGVSVSALYADHTGNLWVSAQTGLWRWGPGTPEHYTLSGGAAYAHALLEEGKGALLMATSKSNPFATPAKGGFEGLNQLVDGKIRSYALPVIGGQFRPTHMFKSSDGSLWFGTMQGLLHLHQGRIDKFSVSDGLSGDGVSCFLEDREGDVWVGTTTGLDRFREFAVPTISVSQGLSIASVDVLEATPDGSIWISAADGLNRWQNGHMTVYGKRNAPDRSGGKNQRERIIGARVTEIGNSGLVSAVYSLGQDDLGRLWAGTRKGVSYFDRGRFVPVPGLPEGDIFSIAGDRQGKVWISHSDGLFYATPEGAVQHFPWARFGQKHAVALLADRSQGGLWLGFFDGGIAYLKDGQVRNSYNAANGLGNGSVVDLQPGSDGAVWAATEGGLSRVKDGRVTTLTSRNGLPCDAVQWAMEDNDRSFWLYMSCGLVRIAGAELKAWASDLKRSVRTTVFDATDGVWSRGRYGRYSRHVAKSPDGRIWFSPPDGVSVIDPRHLPFNKLPPPVYVKQITVSGREIEASQGLRLPAGVHDLVIEYTALSLVAPEKNLFRYRLEGYDRDWTDAGNRRQAFYTNIAPRHYRFHVMASNNSGVWNEAGDALDFSIDPAYYQTTWFRSSCVAAFLAVLWALYRYRLYQIAREFNANLEGRVDERLRVARDLHDTLLQSFQGLLLQFQGARNLFSKRPEEALKRLERAIDQASDAIREGREAIQNLRSSTVISNELAKAVEVLGKELAEQQRAANGDAPAFSVEVEGASQELHAILRDEVYRMTGEALRNAFRHARARRIEVEIRYDARELRVRVRDDGIGIDASVVQQGRAGHYGLPGMRERAKSIAGQLDVWSEQGAGTEVELTVPASVAYASHASRRFRLFKGGLGTNS